MKSKKIIALVVAFAAFMAMATSGLAATISSTTTAYNTESGKVEVTVALSGSADEDVTYLVKGKSGVSGNADNIVYIDQVKLTGEAANDKITYKVDKQYIDDETPSLVVSSNVTGDLEATLGAIPAATAGNYTVEYYRTSAEIGESNAVELSNIGDETVYAYVKANEGYEISSVAAKEGSTALGTAVATNVYAVTLAQLPLVVTTSATFTAPSVSQALIVDEESSPKSYTGLFYINDAVGEVGLTLNGFEYPALTATDANYTTASSYCAVKLESSVALTNIGAYYKASGSTVAVELDIPEATN